MIDYVVLSLGPLFIGGLGLRHIRFLYTDPCIQMRRIPTRDARAIEQRRRELWLP